MASWLKRLLALLVVGALASGCYPPYDNWLRSPLSEAPTQAIDIENL